MKLFDRFFWLMPIGRPQDSPVLAGNIAFHRAGLRPIGIKLSASLSPPKVIEDGLDVSNGDAGDRLASLARDEQ